MSDYSPLCGRKIFRGIAESGEYTYIKLNDEVFTFFDDPDDGYRSRGVMEGIAKPEDYANLIFNLEHTPLEVDVEELDSDGFTGIHIYGSEGLESRTGEPICELGTNFADDWYPCTVSCFSSTEATLVRKLQFEYIAEKILLDKE